MRLIDADELVKDLLEQIPLAENVSIFKDIIESQPTAFDIDKVAGQLKEVSNENTGMGGELVGIQVVRHIHEHLVDGVDNDVLRGNILEINLIDTGAVLHVVRHSRRRDDEVNRQRRVCLQLREEVRCAVQSASRCVVLPSGIRFLHSLLDFK